MKRTSKKLWMGICFTMTLALSTGSFVVGPDTTHAASTSKADRIISKGSQYMGVRYEHGAPAGSTSSFDCSSFTQYVFAQNGIKLPRSSKQQSTVGTYVPRSQLKKGDLVFFYAPIHHVAIYMGDGKIMHTFGKGGVTVTDLNSGWWSSHYTTARRVL
ncbi:hydrolase [Paenibacillus polymyxa]|uniref:C40 family peptidase n=1 Tax=Paenibacillus polymyxa TaxID=1406 RepID=UPI001F59730A|nr:C40 family peptidase [Paenibacillus polymyxa]UNL92119.1 hydrolase [Paenibacillus polymyxa]